MRSSQTGMVHSQETARPFSVPSTSLQSARSGIWINMWGGWETSGDASWNRRASKENGHNVDIVNKDSLLIYDDEDGHWVRTLFLETSSSEYLV